MNGYAQIRSAVHMRSSIFRVAESAIANSLTVKEVSAPSLGSALAVTEIVLWLSIIRHDERLTVRLSGRLEGSSAEDLRLAACPPSALDIDLSGVTSIDCDGERVLVWLRDHGATLYGEGLLARSLCEATHPSPSLQGRWGRLNEKAAEEKGRQKGIGRV